MSRHDGRFSSQNDVKTLLLRALKQQAWRGRYETGRLHLTFPVEFPHKGRISVQSLLWDEASRRLSARVVVDRLSPFREFGRPKEQTRVFALLGEAIPYRRVLAARRTLLYGTRITRDDLKTVELPAGRNLRFALTSWQQAIGKEVRLRRSAGTVLRAHDLRPARLVRRRSTVQVAYNEGGVRVVLQALALENGTKGETVRLRNKFSGREFMAVVDGSGHATVIQNEQAEHAFDAPAEAERKNARSAVAENPFRKGRQRRYDKLLNEPL